MNEFPVPANFSDRVELPASEVRTGDYLEYEVCRDTQGSSTLARGMVSHVSEPGADGKLRIDLLAVPPHSLRLLPDTRVSVRRRDP